MKSNFYSSPPPRTKTWRWLLGFTAFLTLMAGTVFGQAPANYGLSISTGTYTPITTGGGATAYSAVVSDNGNQALTGIPGFTVNGVTYTNVQVNANAQLRFYTTTAPTSGSESTPLSSPITSAAVVITPFAADLINRSGAPLSNFLYQVVGNELIFQWENFTRYTTTLSSMDVLNFQVRLNTSTGAITYVYDTPTIGTLTTSPQVGFRTTTTWAADVNNLQLNVTGSPNTCNWSNAITGNANSSTMYLNSSNPLVTMPSGLTYTWTPQASPSPVRTFAAVSAITSSSATVGWTAPAGASTYNIQYRAVGSCTWTNASGNPYSAATGNVISGLAPTTAYQYRVQVLDGSSNASIWSHIPTSAGGAGTSGYTATGSFTTLAPAVDLQAQQLQAPANVASGCYPSLNTVTIRIRNNGTGALDFSTNNATISASVTGPNPLTFTPVVLSTGTLAPGSTQDVVVSTTYNMSAAGTYTFSASALLATPDVVTSNDNITPTVRTVVAAAALPQSTNFTGFTGSNLSTVFPGWSEAAGATPIGTTSGWRNLTNISGAGTTAGQNIYNASQNEWIFAPKITATASTRVVYKVAVTTWNGSGAATMGSDDAMFVKVSTDCGNTWTTVATYNAASALSNSLTSQTTNLFSYAGQSIIVAFHATGGTTDDLEDYDFHIDDITIEEVPACETPSVTAATAITNSSFDYNFTCSGCTGTYEYSYGAPGFTAGSGTQGTANLPSGSITGLTANTAYQLYIRQNCGGPVSVWVGPINVTTLQIPVTTFPYTENAESGMTGWTFVNGTQANKWFVGSATNNGGSNAVYISNDNGVSNTYNNSSSSIVHIYRDINMTTAAEITLKFDWKALAESCCDDVSAWAVPLSYTPTAGVEITTTGSAPTGRVLLTPYLNNQSSFVNATYTIPAAYSGQAFRLVFQWYNDSSAGSNPPAALDNIQITASNCGSPSALVATPTGGTTATISWAAPIAGTPAAYSWEIRTSGVGGDPSPDAQGTVIAPTVTANVTGLSPVTTYTLWVRTNCTGGNGSSVWVSSGTFTTPQIPVSSYPYLEDAEANATQWGFGNGAQVNQWHVGTATAAGGSKGLYISNDAGVSNAYTTGSSSVVHLYRDFQMPAAGSIDLSFDWLGQGESTVDRLRVWIVPTTFTPTPGTQITSTGSAPTGRVQVGLTNYSLQGSYTTANVSIPQAYSNTLFRLVFEWRNDGSGGTQPPAAIDNIAVNYGTCFPPTAITATGAITTASATYTASGLGDAVTEYQWEVRTSADNNAPGSGSPLVSGTSTSSPISITGLTASTTGYKFYIRTDCSGPGFSGWIGPITFSTGPCVPVYSSGKTSGDLISNVEIIGTTLANNSGTAQTNPAYTLFTGPTNTASLAGGTIYTVSVEVGTWGQQHIRAWVDYNENGIFEDSETIGSTVIADGQGNAGPFPASTFLINLACDAPTGLRRMRIRSAWTSTTGSLLYQTLDPCASYGFGETEDYDITITPPPACPQPYAGVTSAITATSATIGWSVGCTETSWDLHVTAAGGGAPSGPASHPGLTSSTGNVISGLTPQTGYEYWIRAFCNPSYSLWTGPFLFNTLALPPVNDDCANATNLTVNADLACGVTSNGTTLAATASSETAPTCSAAGTNDDVWYTFTATGTTHIISLTSAADMAFAVYSGSCGSLTQVACSDPNSLTLTGLTASTVYHVRVWTATSTLTTTATFTICVGTPPPPPANDNCAGAVNLTVNGDLNCGAVTAGNTISATASSETAPTCVASGTNDDVWFTFTATGSTHYVTLSNIVPAFTDMAMAVYSGACGSLTHVQCSDPNSMILTGLTASTVYHVRVWTGSSSISTSASFNICIGSPPPPPANDNCAGAVALTVNPDLLCGTTTAGTTISATQSSETAPSCGASGTNDDVWYSFVATQSTHVVTLTVPSFTDMAMAFYSGSCGSLTQVACSDPNTASLFGLTASQTYYVRVYTWSSSALTSADFSICVGTPPPPPPPPANDDCSNATAVTVNSGITCSSTSPGTLVGATPSSGPVQGPGTYDDDVWYSFTATSDIHTIALTFVSGSTGDFVFQVLDDCGAGVAILTSDPQTATVEGLTPSAPYYIRVASWTSTPNQTSTFTVCVTTPPPPPANDKCTNAQLLTVSPSCGAGVSGTTLSATQDADPTPTCSFGTTRDVWYRFNTGTNVALNVNITLGTASSVGVQLYNACGTPSTSPTVCSTSSITAITGLAPSTQYYLRVFTGQFSTAGTYTICIAPPPPPPVNDNCAAATAFPTIPNTGTPVSVTVNTLSATPSPQAQCGFAFPDDDVWYTFTVPVGFTQINYSTSNISGSGDRYYELYTSCSSSSVVCFDSENGSITGLTGGTTYTLRVFTYFTGAVSNFNLFLSVPPPPPANDQFCNATVLPVNAGCSYTLATTLSATNSSGVAAPSCGSGNNDVWFTVTVPTSGAIDINTQLLTGANALTDGVMAVYTVTGTCPSLNFTQIAGACDDDSGPGLLPSISLTGRTFGEVLYIRFWAWSQPGNFGICVANGGTPAPVNDVPAGAVNVVLNGNSFPNCGLLSGDVTAGGNSPESSIFSGNDLWYRFTAASTAVSITMSSSGLDNALVLYDNSLVQMPGASAENALGVGGTETLNYDGLTIGQQYYISAGNAFGAGGGSFQLCVRQLMPSAAADGNTLTQDLCSNFKPTWRGASNYTYIFTGTGATPVGPTTITSTTQIPLSAAALQLQYGGTYSVRVDANYENLTYGNNIPDSPITVQGVQLCNLTINPHATMFTKATQACPATLLRGNILSGKPFICGATGFTVSFQKKASCAGVGDYIDPTPWTVTTPGASSNLPLGFTAPQQLAAQSWYEVRWRPEFAYGSGTFGTPMVIFIGGSVMEESSSLEAVVNGAVKVDGSFVQASLYPNPNNGDMVNLNVAGVESDNVFVRIMDGMGRVVYTNRYSVDGSLSTVATFAKPLAAGLYMVEFTVDGEVITQRMMVQK